MYYAYGESWYCTVSRSYFKEISRTNGIYDLRLLSREYLYFEVIVGFTILKDSGRLSLRRVSSHVGMDITAHKLFYLYQTTN
jgi:hypothetical protein